MAEWLRRWTRNPMGFSLTGSNPVRDDTPFECQGLGRSWTLDQDVAGLTLAQRKLQH